MRIILDSTSELGALELQGVQVPARIWIGRTEGGEPVMAFITRLAPLSKNAESALARGLLVARNLGRAEEISRRHQAVTVCGMDQVSTCAVIEDGAAIRFSPCGITSHNQNDVANRYCGACHRFIGAEL